MAGVALAALPPDVRRAVDDMLACERPEGGFTYACGPGPHGAVTWPLVRARRVAEPLGLADWDVVVVRSPGTPAAGLVLLDAWRRGGDPADLAAARRAGDLLIALQLPSGGWFSEVPVHGTHAAAWFRVIAHWATLDDDVTSGAVRLLLALFEATGDSRYRLAAESGLELLLTAQLPGGGWPLTWRPAWIVALRPSFEDWPSTNDAATAGPILALLDGARVLGRDDLLTAARRGGTWLVRAQGSAPQSAWAQQYDAADHPAPGRRFEPAALASWETREMTDALRALARATGDREHLCPSIEAAAAWLARSAIAPGCWARFYAPQTNAPVYLARDGRPVDSWQRAKRPYRWIGDYGIPGLLAELGLDQDGRPRDPATPLPPRRIYGDPGFCPGDIEYDEAYAHLPRLRIARAAFMLAALDPLPPSPCDDGGAR